MNYEDSILGAAIIEPSVVPLICGELSSEDFTTAQTRNTFMAIQSLWESGLPVDLVLSGHAHGGIVRLPFIGGLLDVHRRLGAEYEKGIYEENNTVMIVSRGLGNSIVVPRFLNRPELVCVTLKTSD